MSPPQQITIEQAISKAKKAAKAGNLALATELYNTILQGQPDHTIAKKGLRKLQKQQRRRPSGQTITADPSPEQLDFLVDLCQSGQMARAEGASQDLLKTYPRSVIVMNILGVALQRQGKLSAAVQVLDKAISIRPDFAEAFVNRAIVLKELGEFDRALVNYETAMQLKPDYVEAYYNCANLLKDLGQPEAAVTNYQKALKLSPDFAAAHRNLSALKTYAPGDTQLSDMERLYAKRQTDESSSSELCFALAKAYEDLGEYDKSFTYLEKGNRLRKKTLDYRIENDQALFAQIKKLLSDDNLINFAPDEPAAIQPVFITGMMRSGTSLVEQIIASHSRVHGAGELEAMNRIALPLPAQFKGRKLLNSLRLQYLDALSSLNVAENIVTDKMPANFRWIGLILAIVPEAKIIHVNRNAVATCWSIYKHFFPDEGIDFAYDMEDIAAYYKLYLDLMVFWRERFASQIYELDYEQLTKNQEVETRRLLDFCDLPWESQCLDFHKTKRLVRTSSAIQVRAPLYLGSSDAWKAYEDHLRPLIRALA
ncbi:MAG: sulfotransferase [Gammaproteobacteria bacterium]|nr:sulfotransferase [Gammaproteobacteria bacterium]